MDSQTSVTTTPEYTPLASIEELENDTVDVIYPSGRREFKHRQVACYPSPTAGTLHYDKLPLCGHSFVPHHEPKFRNCDSCWFAMFTAHTELTESVSKLYTEQGYDFLVRVRGPKFAKRFKRYLEAMALFQKVAEENKEKNVNSTAGTTVGHEGHDCSTHA